MATLNDLLALLPDNSSGEIDASDLRTIVTALWGRSGFVVQFIEDAATDVRRDADNVLWVGGLDRPAGMTSADIWLAEGEATAPTAPTITTATLDSMVLLQAFSQQLNATGTAPITWSVTAGALPDGITLSSAGVLSGTPTAAVAYDFTVTAQNGYSPDATMQYTGTIAAAAVAPEITTTTLADMQVGVAYTQALAATGDTPITWGVSAGTLPAGLTVNSSSGQITGTPTTEGAYDFTVQAVNSAGSDTQQYTGTVQPAAATTQYTIFGDAAPVGTIQTLSDAASGDWTAQQFYALSGHTFTVVGVRILIPPGSTHAGLTADVGAERVNGAYWASEAASHTNVLMSNGTTATSAALVEGWNEVMLATPLAVDSSGGTTGVIVGMSLGGGTYYLFSSDVSGLAIQSVDGIALFLSETGAAAGEAQRCFYGGASLDGTPARFYGLDILVEDWT